MGKEDVRNIKVMKFGGASLTDSRSILRIVDIISREPSKKIVVLSAFSGVTDQLLDHLNSHSSSSENQIKALVAQLRKRHLRYLEEAVRDETIRSRSAVVLEERLTRLERLLLGILYSEELTPRVKDLVLSFGERLCVTILEGALQSSKINAKALDADHIGLITDGEFGNATAILPKTERNFQRTVLPLIKMGVIPIITGYFGCDREMHTTTFGRGGSDYSAAVVAYAINANIIEIWKDVDGFMTADPDIVPEAKLVTSLSYREAAELAYSGARILHPRTVEPAMAKDIPILVRNTMFPNRPGTHIVRTPRIKSNTIKGISYIPDVGFIRIHGPGIGMRPNIFKELASCIALEGINIRTFSAAQTTIGILLSRADIEPAFKAIKRARIKGIENIEKLTEMALIAVVGEALLKTGEVTRRILNVVGSNDVNVDMISAGTSHVACHFLVKEALSRKTIRTIHHEFFGSSP